MYVLHLVGQTYNKMSFASHIARLCWRKIEKERNKKHFFVGKSNSFARKRKNIELNAYYIV